MPLSGCGRSDKPSKAKGASVPIAAVVTTCTPAQNPTITTVKGPIDTGCGGFEWNVWFDLPVAAAKDGWVIQEINVSFDVKAADGSVVNQINSLYWEAWEVKAGQKGTVWQQHKRDDNDDTYNSSSFPDTKGSVRCVGLGNSEVNCGHSSCLSGLEVRSADRSRTSGTECLGQRAFEKAAPP